MLKKATRPEVRKARRPLGRAPHFAPAPVCATETLPDGRVIHTAFQTVDLMRWMEDALCQMESLFRQIRQVDPAIACITFGDDTAGGAHLVMPGKVKQGAPGPKRTA